MARGPDVTKRQEWRRLKGLIAESGPWEQVPKKSCVPFFRCASFFLEYQMGDFSNLLLAALWAAGALYAFVIVFSSRVWSDVVARLPEYDRRFSGLLRGFVFIVGIFFTSMACHFLRNLLRG